MCDASGDLWLVFNGEIYNYRELQQELNDYPFKSHSDSETILAAYRKWGRDCVDHFVGMFAFAIWDERNKTLFCARDRLGVKPFQYTVLDGNFVFASEIKALLAAGIPARPNWSVWSAYLQHGLYDHGDDSFFEGVKSLAPGHTLTWRDHQIDIRQYWSPITSEAPLDLSDDDAADQLRSLIYDAIHLRLRSDVPLGVNLSGGLDSSTLFAFIDSAAEVGDELNCFTASFDDPRYDESTFAAGVPRKKIWRHHISRLDANHAWDMIDRLMWHEEAPFGGISTLSYYNLHEMIRDSGVTVVLEGQGIDEMLAGYTYYRSPQRHGIYQDGSSFLKPETLLPFIRKQSAPSDPFQRPFSSELNNRLYQDLRYTKLPRVLRMNDRLSMAYGRELRVPFLDHRIVEYCFRLRDDQKIRGQQGKFILRHMLRDYLPNGMNSTGKRGVVTPQREWIRGPLRGRIQELISSQNFRSSGVFDADQVQLAFDQFCDAQGDNAFFIWQWINFDSWCRTFNVST